MRVHCCKGYDRDCGPCIKACWSRASCVTMERSCHDTRQDVVASGMGRTFDGQCGVLCLSCAWRGLSSSRAPECPQPPIIKALHLHGTPELLSNALLVQHLCAVVSCVVVGHEDVGAKSVHNTFVEEFASMHVIMPGFMELAIPGYTQWHNAVLNRVLLQEC